jgi:hypothetical protein
MGGGNGGMTPGNRVEELRRRENGNLPTTPLTGGQRAPKVSTPIPSVFTPHALTRTSSGYPFAPTGASGAAPSTETSSKPAMSIEALNKFQARVLRAKLMDDPNASQLEEEYEEERAYASARGGDEGGAGIWEGSGGGLQGQMGREEGGKRVEVQVLPTLDGRGRLYDVGTGKEDAEVQGKRKKPVKVSRNPPGAV